MKQYLYIFKYLIFLIVLTIVTITFLLIDIPAARKGDLNAFQNYLEKEIPVSMDKHQICGAAVGIIENGTVVYLKGFGYSDYQKKKPVSENTVFQAASISKTITAWGIMKLLDQNKIDLDAPISNYLKSWKIPPSPYNPNHVTIRRLLSHTGGINNVGDGYAGFPDSQTQQSLLNSLISAEDANNQGVQLIYEPGTKHTYSGGGYTVLQLLIEDITSMSFENYMRNEILKPLKMNQSDFSYSQIIKQNLSVVYDMQNNIAKPRFFTAKAAAGLYTTSKDLSQFVATMLQINSSLHNNSVLKHSTLNSMLQPQPEATDLFSDGLGYSVEKIIFKNYNEVYHTGTNLPGWCSLFTTIPSEHDGLILLTNTPGGAALRYTVRSAWVRWKTGSSTISLKIQKLVNILKVAIPTGVLGLFFFFLLDIIKRAHRVI